MHRLEKFVLFSLSCFLSISSCLTDTSKFSLLWKKEVPTANVKSHFSVGNGLVALTIRKKSPNEPNFMLFDHSGLIWEKELDGRPFSTKLSRSGNLVLVTLFRKNIPSIILFDTAGKLVWEKKGSSLLRFSADGENLLTDTRSEEDFFRKINLHDTKGNILWSKEFDHFILDSQAFGGGKYLVVGLRGSNKTYLFDSEKGLLWERETGPVYYGVSKDNNFILTIPLAGSRKDKLLFSVINLKGEAIFQGHLEPESLGPGFINNPRFSNENRVLVETNKNEFLFDFNGKVSKLGIKNEFIRLNGLGPNKKKDIKLSPDLKNLTYLNNTVLEYYAIN